MLVFELVIVVVVIIVILKSAKRKFICTFLCSCHFFCFSFLQIATFFVLSLEFWLLNEKCHKSFGTVQFCFVFRKMIKSNGVFSLDFHWTKCDFPVVCVIIAYTTLLDFISFIYSGLRCFQPFHWSLHLYATLYSIWYIRIFPFFFHLDSNLLNSSKWKRQYEYKKKTHTHTRNGAEIRWKLITQRASRENEAHV